MRRSTRRMKMAASALALMLSLSTGSAFALNLVTNGGFETGDFSGWVQNGSYIYGEKTSVATCPRFKRSTAQTVMT